MRRLYDRDPLVFSWVWIAVYVIVMNLALRFCDGFDNLAEKTVNQMLVPVVCIVLLAILVTWWIVRNGMRLQFGLCPARSDAKVFGYYIPLIAMSCINLKNGLYLPASLPVSVLMMLQLAVAGYVEEIIFRGFLFRGLAKDNLKTAVVISAVTFGLGHIVNLANTEDWLGVLLQVCYAIVIGFLYTVLAYKGGSLFPCIASHMFVNATSVLGREEGPFSDLVVRLPGSSNTGAEQACSAVLIIIIAGSYALWLWRKTEYTTGTKSDFNHKESQ